MKYYVTDLTTAVVAWGDAPAAENVILRDGETLHWGEKPVVPDPPTPPLTLNDHKNNKWNQLLMSRAAEEFSTFTHGGNTYDCDRASTERIIGAVQLAVLASLNNQSFSIDWTLSDYTVVTLNGPQMMAVGQALAQHVQAVHSKGRTKRTAVMNALSFIEVDAITWD